MAIRTGVPIDHTNPERVDADRYGVNPMVTSVSAKDPKTFAAASERAPAPTVFASGDLPPFTASGVDPELLGRLPFGMRHAAAAEPDSSVVLAMIEEAAADPERMSHHIIRSDGLADYERRVGVWVKDADQIQHQVPLNDADFPTAWLPRNMHEADLERRAAAQSQQQGTERS